MGEYTDVCFLLFDVIPKIARQELSGGHALWYTGTLALYHYNFVGVFNVNPAVSDELSDPACLPACRYLAIPKYSRILFGRPHP